MDQEIGSTGEGSPLVPLSQGDEAASRCAWCSAQVPAIATRCPSCNASLAERESLGDMVIPGVTDVDPALKNQAGRSVLSGVTMAQANSQGYPINYRFSTGEKLLLAASVVPGGLLPLVGSAILVKDALGFADDLPKNVEHVGESSESALALADQLDRGEVVAAPPATGSGATSGGTPPSLAPTPDPWSDLPPTASDPWAGTQNDPWASELAPWAGDPWSDPANDPWSTSNGPWSGDPWREGKGGRESSSSGEKLEKNR
jgi:hypothetical protein